MLVSRLMGANKAYIDEHLPHLGDVLTGDIESVLEHGEVFIVGCTEPDVVAAVEALADECPVIDLVRLPNVEKLRSRLRLPQHRVVALARLITGRP